MHHYLNNKLIGWDSNGVFRKRVRKSEHLFKKLDAWGVDYETLSKVKEQGVTKVRIHETEDNLIYSTSIDTLWGEGTVEDYGFGQQIMLPRSLWKVEDYKSKERV